MFLSLHAYYEEIDLQHSRSFDQFTGKNSSFEIMKRKLKLTVTTIRRTLTFDDPTAVPNHSTFYGETVDSSITDCLPTIVETVGYLNRENDIAQTLLEVEHDD